MKNTYTTPEAEKIEFNYRDQVVASSARSICQKQWSNEGTMEDGRCITTPEFVGWYNNEG